jgi:hypothetical protein
MTATPPSVVENAQMQDAQRLIQKQETERYLSDVRDRKRLAMHVCEEQRHFKFPSYSYNLLREVPAKELLSKLSIDDAPLFSASLLPSARSGKALVPYNIGLNDFGSYAYLFDLDQSAVDAPRVLYAGDQNFNSGSEVKSKQYWNKASMKEMSPIYQPYKSKKEWERAVCGEQGRHLANQMLDTLGGIYEGDYYGHTAFNTVTHNEIIMAASAEHIKAIAIPYRVASPHKQWSRPIAELTAAVAGLQHLEEGVDVPVVMYQVTPKHAPDDKPQGDISYLAKGRVELERLAVQAIEKIQALPVAERTNQAASYAISELKPVVQKTLNLDISRPLQEQQARVQLLGRQAIERL